MAFRDTAIVFEIGEAFDHSMCYMTHLFHAIAASTTFNMMYESKMENLKAGNYYQDKMIPTNYLNSIEQDHKVYNTAVDMYTKELMELRSRNSGAPTFDLPDIDGYFVDQMEIWNALKIAEFIYDATKNQKYTKIHVVLAEIATGFSLKELLNFMMQKTCTKKNCDLNFKFEIDEIAVVYKQQKSIWIKFISVYIITKSITNQK